MKLCSSWNGIPIFRNSLWKKPFKSVLKNWTKLNLYSLQWQTELVWEISGASDSYITFSSDGQDCGFRSFQGQPHKCFEKIIFVPLVKGLVA